MPAHPLSVDALRLECELALYRLAAQLPPGWPPQALTVEARANGTALFLRLGPPAAMPAPIARDGKLNARQREVLDAVRVEIDRLGRRVIGREVGEALAAAGNRWGSSTVNAALSELVARGLLVNDNDKRGYGLSRDDDLA